MKPESPTSDLTMPASLAASDSFDEETARAEVYGILSLVYYAYPAPEFIASLRVAVTEAPTAGGFLEEPWRQLVATARSMDDAAIQAEFEALFGGVGKPDIYLFGSHYLSGFLNEKPLAQLRSDLATLGLTRDDTLPETEDHIAYLCEVMRYLIAGDDVTVANLTQQQRFFTQHLHTWVPSLCEALSVHPKARFYAAVAEFTRAFMNVEAQGFDMMA